MKFLQILSVLNSIKLYEFYFMPTRMQSSQTVKIITHVPSLQGAHWGHLSWSFFLTCPPLKVTSVSCSTYVKFSALCCSNLFE